jgi:hypothetical protein
MNQDAYQDRLVDCALQLGQPVCHEAIAAKAIASKTWLLWSF